MSENKKIGLTMGYVFISLLVCGAFSDHYGHKVMKAREEMRAKQRQLVETRLTLVQNVEWADVHTEIASVVRTQDFLPAYRLVELHNGMIFFQRFGETRQLLNDKISVFDTRGARGALVGDRWELTFAKRVKSYDYIIEDNEILIDSKPLPADDR